MYIYNIRFFFFFNKLQEHLERVIQSFFNTFKKSKLKKKYLNIYMGIKNVPWCVFT